MLDIKTLILGDYSTNTYIISDPVSGEAAVIDPAIECRELYSELSASGITELKFVLLTHGHFDHICGAF